MTISMVTSERPMTTAAPITKSYAGWIAIDLDLIRQRVQQQTLARRGHTGDPWYGIQRIACTRIQLLSARQYNRLSSVLDADAHIAVKVAYVIYQKIIAAYADSNRRRGKHVMTRLIDSIRRDVPVGLEKIAQLGRTLWRRRGDILAFFDHHVSNGPTEAINGRLEALRRNALGFRKHHSLSNPFTAAQRRTPRTRQCALNLGRAGDGTGERCFLGVHR
jgi:transposase